MEFEKNLLEYFNGNKMPAEIWFNKYRSGDEKTPEDSFRRITNILGFVESKRLLSIDPIKIDSLSKYGRERYLSLLNAEHSTVEYLQKFVNLKHSIPGGSGLQGIGNPELFSSLSNCFVMGQPFDSYSGINKKEDELTQVMKRRGGGGLDISTIRPRGAIVRNQAKSSSGVVLFAEGYSNKTKQVAQDARRGALMLTLDIMHPDSPEFIESKQDLSKITGANISVKVGNEFMESMLKEKDILLRFPTDSNIDNATINGSPILIEDLPDNELIECDHLTDDSPKFVKRFNSLTLWNKLIQCAWRTAEPGILFTGNWEKQSTDWIYTQYRPISTNPCSELPMQPYDSCRLISTNMTTFVDYPFTENAEINFERVYSIFYEQLTTADIIIDLELEYIDNIIEKIYLSKDPDDLKDSEIKLWKNIREQTSNGRRCGCGFLGMGDMLASLNLHFYSPNIVEKVFKLKMKAELDATIDLAILYGPFVGYSSQLEKESPYIINVIAKEFPEQYEKMLTYGRRNVSWSTGAPTGSLASLTQTTSGIEPLFMPWYKRRKKCMAETDSVDYIDPFDGQKFSEFFILHEQFRVWLAIKHKLAYENIDKLNESALQHFYEISPWYKQTAKDIYYKNRIEIQSIVQKYTTQAISSTINLEKDVKQNLISLIYIDSWKSGLKGNTIYRDGSRAGILVNSNDTNTQIKIKRPIKLTGHYYSLTSNKKLYSIIIGLKNEKPCEIFIVSGLSNLPEIMDNNKIVGEIIKDNKEWYNFRTDTFFLKDITDMEHEEKLVSLMISGLMRNNAKLLSIIKILNKTKPIAGSFTYKLVKILSSYVPNGEISGENCINCQTKLIFNDGCMICPVCGWTKC